MTKADEIILIVKEFLEVWDSPDSPEAMAEIVNRLRDVVES